MWQIGELWQFNLIDKWKSWPGNFIENELYLITSLYGTGNNKDGPVLEPLGTPFPNTPNNSSNTRNPSREYFLDNFKLHSAYSTSLENSSTEIDFVSIAKEVCGA
jgi:hypothetical protein